MCLYPRLIKNKRYLGYKLKKGDITCNDYRKLYVPIGCGKCLECRKQKAQNWRVRMLEELKTQDHAYFVTMTFSNESLLELQERANDRVNIVAKKAVRLFLERWRKKHGKSLRHWFITELGHENTERIHLHGIIFPTMEINNDYLQLFWKYGCTYVGDFCNEQTINYIVKYVTKTDVQHKHYEPCIMCSAGMGAGFIDKFQTKLTYNYVPNNTNEYYLYNNGQKVALPIYYRNKLFTQAERDKLWTEMLDKNERYILGIKIKNFDTEDGQKNYFATLKDAQEYNKLLLFGDTSEEWKTEEYKITINMLQRAKGGRDTSTVGHT